MSKEIPRQKIDSCTQCFNIAPATHLNCEVPHNSLEIPPDCPLKDWQEMQASEANVQPQITILKCPSCGFEKLESIPIPIFKSNYLVPEPQPVQWLDKLDDLNARYGVADRLCIFCDSKEYDTMVGIIHDNFCLIKLLRNKAILPTESHDKQVKQRIKEGHEKYEIEQKLKAEHCKSCKKQVKAEIKAELENFVKKGIAEIYMNTANPSSLFTDGSQEYFYRERLRLYEKFVSNLNDNFWKEV